MSTPNTSPLEAELLIATGCVHCPVVLEGVSTLLKEGVIGSLRVTNIVSQPERAQELGVRSVPWLQLGPFTLQGLHSPAELRDWAKRAGSVEGMSLYLHDQLKQGHLEAMEKMLANQPQWLMALLPLLEDEDTDMKVRIGVDALLESLASDTDLSSLVEGLGRLSQHDRQALRSDATHYLALTGSPSAIPYLEARLQDDSAEVREIAEESLAELRQ
ncbi:MAG: HEAT repeat domain-containing protein [Thiohalomonadales bacterium]|nr:HEAT repeat domain-containing protein [Thiohalomonadales bacterium]